VSTTM